jgi:hypothetical protein
MKKSIYLVIILPALLLFYGCASVQIYSNNDLKNKTGLKFYSVKPYLLVELKSEKDGTIKTTMLYLPDLANPQYLNVKPGIGSNELKMAFSNGILNSYGLTYDADVAETINSVAGLISKSSDAVAQFAAPGVGGKEAGEEEVFLLYEILITPEGTRLKRVRGEE